MENKKILEEYRPSISFMCSFNDENGNEADYAVEAMFEQPNEVEKRGGKMPLLELQVSVTDDNPEGCTSYLSINDAEMLANFIMVQIAQIKGYYEK